MSAPESPPLEAGQVIVVELDDRGVRRSFPTRVLEIDDDLVWVESPVEYALPVTLAAPISLIGGAGSVAIPEATDGTSDAVIHCWRVMDARYTCPARLLAARLSPRPSLALRIAGCSRVQDRAYFRVPLNARAQATGEGPDGEAWLFSLQILDLSAAGLRARSQLPLWVGAELRLALRLRDLSETLSLRARVARVIQPPRPPDLSCVVGAAFVDLPPHAREQIIRFALSLQIEELRRGKG